MKPEPVTQEELIAPARGCCIGLVLGIIMWIILVIVIVSLAG